MIPRLLIGSGEIPGGAGELRLIQRGSEYSIMLGANELMSSRAGGSEEALAAIACAGLRTDRPRVLIGGLGMGFTLRAALAELGPGASVLVAELVPAVIRWAEGPLAHLMAGSLSDPRVSLIEADVATVIAAPAFHFDAILLDVDNGPDGLTVPSNDRLYDAGGLARAKAALRPGGVLAIWSAAPDAGFSDRLRRAGFAVEEAVVGARGGSRGSRHVIWTARKAGPSGR
jgi:spermidine synthase